MVRWQLSFQISPMLSRTRFAIRRFADESLGGGNGGAPMTLWQLPFGRETYAELEGEFTKGSEQPFSEEMSKALQAPLAEEEIEVKPDGSLFLPESRYRKKLLGVFGPGGWCLVPRGPHALSGKILSREYALMCHGKFVAVARGAALIQGFSNPAASTEAVKSNALMRTCKDLGIGNELWDPSFINAFKKKWVTKKMYGDKQVYFKNFKPNEGGFGTGSGPMSQ